MKKTIGIIFGGCSSEYEVSLQSAYAVITHLDKDKYEKYLIGITREGKWYHYNGDVEKIKSDTWSSELEVCVPVCILPDKTIKGVLEYRQDGNTIVELDAAFPVLHGKNGEDGTVQGLIELSGIALVGCNTLASAICMDKDRAHQLAREAGVEVPQGTVILKGTSYDEICRMIELYEYPLYVKPLKAGSSFGITKIPSSERLKEAVDTAFKYDDEIIIEENIDGFEVGCAVMGNESLTIGRVDEIELAEGFFDYEEKYTLKSSKIHMPARISSEREEEIKNTAAKLYRAMGCSGFARVDMFLTPSKKIVFNEINTIPGFTSHSRFPNMMGGIGMSFEDIVNTLVKEAIERSR